LDTKPRSVYKRITGLLVVLVSLAAITATVLAGHSGAQSVWELNAATATDISSTGTITINEVALHATVDDCWSVVNGNVYDLTQWINEHPGGSGPVESMCGIDASTPFSNQHNGQGEPETALASFQIGILG
jgi:cytochrome b involved in lipid metabolism